MKNRTVKNTIPSADIRMGDITLKQPLPFTGIEQVDPFLLLHHLGPITQIAGNKNIVDIGAHPHRGFEPISFIIVFGS